MTIVIKVFINKTRINTRIMTILKPNKSQLKSQLHKVQLNRITKLNNHQFNKWLNPNNKIMDKTLQFNRSIH